VSSLTLYKVREGSQNFKSTSCDLDHAPFGIIHYLLNGTCHEKYEKIEAFSFTRSTLVRVLEVSISCLIHLAVLKLGRPDVSYGPKI